MRILILIIAALFSFRVAGQQLGARYQSCTDCNSAGIGEEYSETENFISTNVTSDYGRRDNPGDSEWHRGIDLSSASGDGDLGDHIMPILTGRISILKADLSYKFIIIDPQLLGPVNSDATKFAYAHIFRNKVPDPGEYERLGDMYLYQRDGINTSEFVILHIPKGATNSSQVTAYGTKTGFISWPGILGNITIRTQVDDLNIPIAPLGDSDTGPAHLHINSFVYNVDNDDDPLNHKNPLQDITHTEPLYDVIIGDSLFAKKINTEPSSIMARIRMSGQSRGGTYPVVMNVDQVELIIRSGSEPFRFIQGKNYESRISLGGARGTTIYPRSITNVDGSENVTGVNPFAYSTTNLDFEEGEPQYNPDAGNPYDDFYFSDFVTRVNNSHVAGKSITQSNLAKSNEEALYKDGLYNARVTMRTITGTQERGVSNFTLDNFRPYVKSVTIFRADKDGDVLYLGNFNQESQQVENFDLSEISSTDDLYLEVTFSEQMKDSEVSVTLKDVGDATFADVTNNHTKYYYTLPRIPASEINSPQTLSIVAKDANDNDLQTNPANFINYRTGLSSWSKSLSEGTDENYIFNNPPVSCSTFDNKPQDQLYTKLNSAGCIYAGFTVTKQNPASFEPVVFTSLGTNPSYTYKWNFGSGAVPTSVNEVGASEVTVMYQSDGPKDVSLEICDGPNCSPVRLKEGFMNIDAPFEPLLVDFSAAGTTSIDVNEQIRLSAHVTGAQGPLTYQWSLGGGLDPGLGILDKQSILFSYATEGKRNISLTVSDGLRTVTKTKNNFINVNGYFPEIEVDLLCSSIVNLNGVSIRGYEMISWWQSDGVAGNERFRWSMGDGRVYNTPDVVHEYSGPGTYTVELQVCDDSGCDTGECTVTLDASAFPGTDVKDIKIEGIPLYDNDDFPSLPLNYSMEVEDITVFTGGVLLDHYLTIYRNGLEVRRFDFMSQKKHTLIFTEDEAGFYQFTLTSEFGTIDRIDVQNSVKFVQVSSKSEFIQNVCIADISNIGLSNYCWNDSDLPVFSFDVSDETCPWEFYIFDVHTSEIVASSADGYQWTGSTPETFPYTSSYAVTLTYDCGRPRNDCDIIAQEFETITLYGNPETQNLKTEYAVCVGASLELDIENDPEFSYEWSAVSGSNINYLSDRTASNPIFTAYEEGSFLYDLTVTNKDFGCSSTERITIVTDGIEAKSYSETLIVGSKLVLEAPSEGINYQYRWSPSTYLSDPNVSNPIITAPETSGSITYTVDISYRNCTAAAASVELTFENPPPYDLQVNLNQTNFPFITWKSNGLVSYFKLQRQTNYTIYEDLAILSGDVYSFLDIDCIKSLDNYCYRVEAFDLAGRSIGVSNTDCERIPLNLQVKKSVDHGDDTFQAVNRESKFDSKNVTNSYYYNGEYISLNGNRYTNFRNEELGYYQTNFFDSEMDLNNTVIRNEVNADYWPTDLAQITYKNLSGHVRDYHMSVGFSATNNSGMNILSIRGILVDNPGGPRFEEELCPTTGQNNPFCNTSFGEKFIAHSPPKILDIGLGAVVAVTAMKSDGNTATPYIAMSKIGDQNDFRNGRIGFTDSRPTELIEIDYHNGFYYVTAFVDNNKIIVYRLNPLFELIDSTVVISNVANGAAWSEIISSHLYIIATSGTNELKLFKYRVNQTLTLKNSVVVPTNAGNPFARGLFNYRNFQVLMYQSGQTNEIGSVVINTNNMEVAYESSNLIDGLSYLMNVSNNGEYVVADYLRESTSDIKQVESLVMDLLMDPTNTLESIFIDQSFFVDGTDQTVFGQSISLSGDMSNKTGLNTEVFASAKTKITQGFKFSSENGNSLKIAKFTPPECPNAGVNSRQEASVFTSPEPPLEQEGVVQILLYPNPANQSFMLAGKNLSNSKIEIFDLQGRRVHSQNSYLHGAVIIDTSEYPSGIYTVKVIKSKTAYDYKLIVKH